MKSAIVFTAGFAEVDEAGAAAQGRACQAGPRLRAIDLEPGAGLALRRLRRMR